MAGKKQEHVGKKGEMKANLNDRLLYVIVDLNNEVCKWVKEYAGFVLMLTLSQCLTHVTRDKFSHMCIFPVFYPVAVMVLEQH